MDDDQRPTPAAELRVELKSVVMSFPPAGTTVVVVMDITFPSGDELAMSDATNK